MALFEYLWWVAIVVFFGNSVHGFACGAARIDRPDWMALIWWASLFWIIGGVVVQ